MSALLVSAAVAASVLVGGLLGLNLYRILPEPHRSKEVQDLLRLITGMLSVLASLVLGLLVATAHATFETADQSLRNYAAELILLDETLRDYGEQALAPRRLLRNYTLRLLHRTWPEDPHRSGSMLREDTQAGVLLETLHEELRALKPGDAGQTWLQNQALVEITTVMRLRWQLMESDLTGVQPVVLAILAAWLLAIFASFGLNMPRNATVFTALLLAALSIGSAIFLVEELDTPFGGLLKISPSPVRMALEHMLPPGR